jgi:L-arabinose isomerase
MTKQEAAVYYSAYAELEAAAEAFYAAAHKTAELMPTEAAALYALCDAVNIQIVAVDTELDEVLA